MTEVSMLKTAMLASLIIAATSAPALAEMQRAETTKVTIGTRGFDFSNAKDVRTVHDMLWRAAKSVCNSHIDHQLAAKMSDSRCAEESLDRAVAQMGQPMLTAYHNDRAIKADEPRLAGPRAQPDHASSGGAG
jgi:UrcA family protein